jgi:hypothetical protein
VAAGQSGRGSLWTYQALVAVPLGDLTGGANVRGPACRREREKRESRKGNVRIRWESLDFGGGLGLATEERKEGQGMNAK